MHTEKGIPFDTWETTFPERLLGIEWRNEIAVFTSDVDLDAVVKRFGMRIPSADVLEGLGPMQLWLARFPCGCELALVHLELAPQGRQLGVVSNDSDLDHVLHHFALPITWRIEPKDAPFPIERWSLFRQDDNGNRFRIRDFDSMFSAECARREFEGPDDVRFASLHRCPARLNPRA